MEAFNRRDRAAFLAVCDPEAEHHPSREWPESAPIRGDEAIWDFVEVVRAWDNAEFEWGELTDAGGDEIVANLRAQPRGKTSDADVLWSLGVILTFSGSQGASVAVVR